MGFYSDPETVKMGFTKWRVSRAKLVSRWSEGKSNLATFWLTRLGWKELETELGKMTARAQLDSILACTVNQDRALKALKNEQRTEGI